MTYREWLEWRKQGIGGSDAPVVMNASPWSTPFELWAEKTNRPVAYRPSNPAMRRGLDLEPVARAEYERVTGIKMPAGCLEHPKKDFIRASFDGLNEKEGRALEIKVPGRQDHLIARTGKIPAKYIWQCVHLLLVSGLPWLDYFSFDGVRGVIIPFKRDLALEKKLLLAENRFWKHVTTDVAPPQRPAKVFTTDSVFPVRGRR